MGLFDRFKRRKETTAGPTVKPIEEKPSLLKQLCGEDTALYEDLRRLVYLNPNLNKETCKEALIKADASRAALDYRHGASLAINENNLDYFIMALNKYAEVAKPDDIKFKRVREVPEKALEIAQKYYYEKGIKPISLYREIS